MTNLVKIGCWLLVCFLSHEKSSAQEQQFWFIWIAGDSEMTIFGPKDRGKDYVVFSSIFATERIAPYGVVKFPSDLSFSNAGKDVHIDGYVRAMGASSFLFPVGDSRFYGPFAASADGTTGAYFHSDPSQNGQFPTTSKEPELLGSVSSSEYWDIDGKNATKITLTWDSLSQIKKLVPQLRTLTIVGWRGGKWTKIASSIDDISILGGSSTFLTGSITTQFQVVPDEYEAYTFGNSELDSADAALHFDLMADDFYIYPNPATNMLKIRSARTGQDSNFSTFKITDISGRDYTSLVSREQADLKIGKLTTGMYVVRFYDFYGKSVNSNFVVAK